jgi:hypothetical protein
MCFKGCLDVGFNDSLSYHGRDKNPRDSKCFPPQPGAIAATETLWRARRPTQRLLELQGLTKRYKCKRAACHIDGLC